MNAPPKPRCHSWQAHLLPLLLMLLPLLLAPRLLRQRRRFPALELRFLARVLFSLAPRLLFGFLARVLGVLASSLFSIFARFLRALSFPFRMRRCTIISISCTTFI